jgi:ribosomal protein S27E
MPGASPIPAHVLDGIGAPRSPPPITQRRACRRDRDGVEGAATGAEHRRSADGKGDGERFFGRNPLAIVLREFLRERSEGRLIRAAVTIKSWIAQTPSVEEVRPVRCSGCGLASRPVGGRIRVHGQGLLHRQVRGVLDVEGRPGVFSVAARRYECQGCSAVMTVVPAGMLARRQYSASSIALALHLWLAMGQPDRLVRAQLCAWQRRGRSGRGWTQLYRWAGQALGLFGLPRPVPPAGRDTTVLLVLSMLRSLAPVVFGGASESQQVFAGAAHTR